MAGRTSLTRTFACSLLLVLLLGGESIFAWGSVICKWQADALGACTIELDGGSRGQWEFAVPMLNDRDLHGTFLVIGSVVEAWYGTPGRLHMLELLEIVRHGHEVGTQTYSNRDLKTLTDAEIGEEMEVSLQSLSRYGIRPTSMIYPFGSNDDRVRAAVAGYVEFARGGPRAVPNSSEWSEINPLDLKWSNGADRYSSLGTAASLQRWAIIVFGEIGYGGPTIEEFEQFLDAVVSMRDSGQLWVDTLSNIGTYVRERGFATLKTETSADGNTLKVTLTVGSECPSPLIPLTLKTEIPGMSVLSATQADHPVGFQIIDTSGQRFVLYDALPNVGPVTLNLEPSL